MAAACDWCNQVPVDQQGHPWIVVNMPSDKVALNPMAVAMGRTRGYIELIFCSKNCLWLAVADPEEAKSASTS
jgi:hypothetical protein